MYRNALTDESSVLCVGMLYVLGVSRVLGGSSEFGVICQLKSSLISGDGSAALGSKGTAPPRSTTTFQIISSLIAFGLIVSGL